MSLGGCGTAGRAIGEEKLNSLVGSSIEGTYLETSPVVERIEGADATQYIQKSNFSECSIEFVVEHRTKKILSEPVRNFVCEAYHV